MNKKIYIALAVLVVAAMACGTSSTGSSSKVLFQDKFTDTSSGWDHASSTDGSTDYQNGAYRINVLTPNVSLWANPSKKFQSDVSVEVDAAKSGGPDDNAFGVICRYQDAKNFYKFYITSDGYAGISKEANGDTTVISSSDGKIQQVDHINQGSATNHIRADCVGSNLTLYANGSEIASASDSSFTGGDVGLIARTYDTAGTDILFTNFVVSKP
jgi:pectate lyase